MGIDMKLLYPERKRCGRCRSYFGFQVIAGLWCSANCARREEISSNPEDWPREHYSMIRHGNGRKEKRDFLYWDTAKAAARRYDKEAYQCSYCLGIHIGTPDPNKVYPAQTVYPPSERRRAPNARDH